MFRMWGKIVKDTRLVRDTVICISDYSMSRTAMVQDNFIEHIDFDFLEIQVIEE